MRATGASRQRLPRDLGSNRMHAVLAPATRAWRPTPSDVAVALVALDAEVELVSASGSRTVALATSTACRVTPRGEHDLRPGELITSAGAPAGLPSTPPTSRCGTGSPTSRPVLRRGRAGRPDGHIVDARVAVGGVATVPWRLVRSRRRCGCTGDEDAFEARGRRGGRRGRGHWPRTGTRCHCSSGPSSVRLLELTEGTAHDQPGGRRVEVTGRAKYGADHNLPGMASATCCSARSRTVRSGHGHHATKSAPRVIGVYSPFDSLVLRTPATFLGETWVPLQAGRSRTTASRSASSWRRPSSSQGRGAAHRGQLHERPALTSLEDGWPRPRMHRRPWTVAPPTIAVLATASSRRGRPGREPGGRRGDGTPPRPRTTPRWSRTPP